MNVLTETPVFARRIRSGSKTLSGLAPLVIADFLRPPVGRSIATAGMQNDIAGRLHDWLQPALSRVFEGRPDLGLWGGAATDGVIAMPAEALFAELDADASTAGWVRSYRAPPTDNLAEILAPAVADRFVVGFELSPFLTGLLGRLKVPYLSMAYHPLRFLDDYLVRIESNVLDAGALSDFAVDPDEIAYAAQLRRAALRQSEPSRLPDGATVLFGQVEVDAALVDDTGRLHRLQDHDDRIAELVDTSPAVVFRPHPYAADVDAQLRFLSHWPSIRATAESPYGLLSAPQIGRAVALSSSVLSEARHFGVPSEALLPGWDDRGRDPAFGVQILSPAFWSAVLDCAAVGRTRRKPLTNRAGVSLRDLSGVDWERHKAPRQRPSEVVVRAGDPILFGKDRLGDSICLGDGWHAPSADHRWTRDREAWLSFRLPGPRPAEHVARLLLVGMAGEAHPITVQIHCDGRILAEHRLASREATTLTFPLPGALASPIGDVELEIRCSSCHSPEAMLGLGDRRALGIAVYRLAVEPVAQGLPLIEGHHQALGIADLPTPGWMASGWHQPEPGGAWTNGRRARLDLALSGVPDDDRVLRLRDVRAFLSPMLPTNTLLVRVAGETCLAHRFESGAPGDIAVSSVDLDVPVPRRILEDAGAAFPVELELLGSHSPVTAGFSDDGRELGVMVGSLEWQSAIVEAARRPPARATCICGPVHTDIGLGVMTRNALAALDAALSETGAPPEARPFALNLNPSRHIDRATGLADPGTRGSDIQVFVGDVTRIDRLVQRHGAGILRDRHVICYGAWELAILPDHLADTRSIDEYWGLSSFIAEAAARRMDIPVRAMPLPVTLHYPDRLRPRADFGIPEDAFAFLFTFSIDSTMSRKNPEAVLAAFQAAFPDRAQPVALVIKSMVRQASQKNRAAYADFREAALSDPRVVLVEDTLDADAQASLFMRCDAYVSLHRAEGFGLTMAEAMGYGLPTVGTGYSGNLDFMDPDTSCLVDFRLVGMAADDYHDMPYRWAEPDIEDAARHMARIEADPAFRERIARAGKRRILDDFSPLAVGRKLLARIDEIRAAAT